MADTQAVGRMQSDGSKLVFRNKEKSKVKS